MLVIPSSYACIFSLFFWVIEHEMEKRTPLFRVVRLICNHNFVIFVEQRREQVSDGCGRMRNTMIPVLASFVVTSLIIGFIHVSSLYL